MRTHYCGQINSSLIGEEVKLCGWVHHVRDHGKMLFINLRDRDGIVQIFVAEENKEQFALAKELHNEYVIQVSGIVQKRPVGLINPNMATGEVEIIVSKLVILNSSQPLPFNVNDLQEISDDLRLKYRYLDLRRPEMSSKLLFRSRVTHFVRNYLDNLGFIDIETPILTKSTPEGARDFLVPSRNYPGKFYALPQSPQIFKQLLMVAGFDRYYQFVKCFRDEDSRADRQPEFTQLDIELAFTGENTIMQMMEAMFRDLFVALLNVKLPKPFPRLTYQEAMDKYGSDKPDLRIPLEIVNITDIVKQADFAVFANVANSQDGRVAALRLPGGSNLTRKQLDGYAEAIKVFGAKGLAYIKVNDRAQGLSGLQSPILKYLTLPIVTRVLERTEAADGDTIFIVADKVKIVNEALGSLRLQLGHDHNLVKNSWEPLWVVDFPMFEATDKGWTFVHHPFTAPVETDPQKILANPGAIFARAYDMVLNGTELGGGSIRIASRAMQDTVFKVLGYDAETAQERFSHLLESFKYGYPPEGGIALGLDRIIMLMTNSKSIRDVIAFPKTLAGVCLLTDAPAEISPMQLQELGIKS
jgi:aspartyl-tRNA synthetase